MSDFIWKDMEHDVHALPIDDGERRVWMVIKNVMGWFILFNGYRIAGPFTEAAEAKAAVEVAVRAFKQRTVS